MRMNVAMAQLYAALILAGAVLITLELFVPGGIVGALGALALLGGAVVAFRAFPGALGVLAAVGAFLIAITLVTLWLKVFPKTRIGQALTVSIDLKDASSAEGDLRSLLGQSGRTVSQLRPAGFALVAGKRVDVVTRGEMIEDGVAIRVVLVEGNRVVVEADVNNTEG